MSHRNVFLFGHSHLTILQEVYLKLRASFGTEVEAGFMQLFGLYHPFVALGGDKPVYHADLEADLVRNIAASNAKSLFGTLTGSEHFVWAVQGQARPFDVILPGSPELPTVPGAEIVPYALMRQTAYDQLVNLFRFYRRIGDLTNLPVYQILPPPPASSQERVQRESPEPFHSMMKSLGVPHPAIRYKLWVIWTAIATEVAEQTGVGLLQPPERTMDQSGLLSEEYSGDCVHANAQYGYLVWKSIEAAAE